MWRVLCLVMIPKVIHYCWFGKGKKPDLFDKCIQSWRLFCPDYKIQEWNESNFDINCCAYVREAYDRKKYAFVTDYVRLFVMYMYGGIYMDTDVEVVGSLDRFLSHEAFSGFESEKDIPTGIMAGEQNFPLYRTLLDYYNNRHFVDKEGNIDTTTNVVIITKILLERGFVPNGRFQIVDGLALYPRDYFCPLDDATGILHDSINTVTIHWFNKSWVPRRLRIRSRITRLIRRWLGVDSLAFLRKKRG